MKHVFSPALLLVAICQFVLAGPLWAVLVAKNEAMTPAEQQKLFKLPPGFVIELVVSEPTIGQPMNLNFDARGRLWITHSLEYPYPAKGPGVEPRSERFGPAGENPPRDRLTVVEGLGGSGPYKATHFAEGLNIPIGNVPLTNGDTALVYSIPGIYRCTDTDGDGRSDRRELLYGRFGNIDTHGMSSSYRRWIDGWVYGCHGFSNTSEVRDAGGRVVKMTSGNTYRFREDGSHFQQFTWGQVNPFGMTFDPWGNLYDSDCHTLPIYMLLRGAYYDSFGKPDDGLGYGPKMIDHLHGSTGICGPAYYAADHFPEGYRGSVFICNPVNGQVHHDRLKEVGSTFLCDTQPDLISCEDEWFRPVDAVVGPDGALYIADFYNAIIGHYEVELKHPKRDRSKGRVWRITYKGTDGQAAPPRPMPDLTKLETPKLVPLLGDANLTVRTLATNQLVDRTAANDAAKSEVQAAVSSAMLGEASPELVSHGMWALERLGKLSDFEVKRLAEVKAPLVRTHALRVLAERSEWSEDQFRLVRLALNDAHAMVRRVAADALGRHIQVGNVSPLLAAWAAADPADTHLVHVIRIALRDHLNENAVAKLLLEFDLTADQRKRLVEIASAARGEQAASFLLANVEAGKIDPETLRRAAPQVARYGEPAQIERLAELAKASFGASPRDEFAIFQLVSAGLGQRGLSPDKHPTARRWFDRLAPELLAGVERSLSAWTNHAVPNLAVSASPWGLSERPCEDGKKAKLIDSIVNGEQLTGIYRSREFVIPERLSFYLCGHNGLPGTNPPAVNHIRLNLASGEVIAKQTPPRNDTAKKFTWELKDHAGQRGVIEIVDADTGSAYAWIGVGRFDPAVVPMPEGNTETEDSHAVAAIGQFGLTSFAARVAALAESEQRPAELRAAAAEAAIRLGLAERTLPLLAEALKRSAEPDLLRKKAAELLGALDTPDARGALVAGLVPAPAPLQRDIALALCSHKAGAAALVETVTAGKASGRLLQDQRIAERLKQSAAPEIAQRAAEIVKTLPPVEERLVALVAQRAAAFAAASSSAERGQAVFKKNCAACHKLGNEGNVIGPQLEGIGARGSARLLEDLLDPNRNVDAAFRTVSIETEDGNIVTGLPRRQEGKTLVLADSQGKEVRISEDNIAKRRPSDLSLMPANLTDIIKEDELFDLLAYLLTQTTPKKE